MKKRLHKLLSILCAAVMLCGCLALGAAADGAGSATVTIAWSDDNDQAGVRPDQVNATLTVGESQYPVTLTAAEGWAKTFSGLKEAGAWTVDTPDGYSQTVSTKDGVTVVTLSYKAETISVRVSQAWVDDNNAKGVRPQSVNVRLLADGAPFQAALPLNSGNGWTTTFTNLPKYRQGGTEAVVYTVQPADEIPYYASSVSGNQESGFTVTGTLQTGTLTVKASFSGGPDGADWSALTVTLAGPDQQVPATVNYSQFTGGVFTVENVLTGSYVAQEKNAGELAEGYMLDAAASKTVATAEVKANAESTISLVNAYQPLKPASELPGDGSDADLSQLKFRIEGPDSSMSREVYYSQFTDGKFELEGLKPGTYVVYEINAGTLVDCFELTSASITGVAITVSDQGSATAKLFNQYQPMTPAPTATPTPPPEGEPIEITVTKTWEDNDDKDGNRPTAVIVWLLANGEKTSSAALSAGNNWQFTFTELPQVDEAGKEITYTVEEDPVEWYDSKVDGFNITNVYHPETTSVSVKKQWDDKNNKSRMRPKQIRVTLSNGMSVYLNEGNNWSATIQDLPTRLNGQTVVYSWSEQEVLGYVMSNYEVKGTETVITNSLYRKPGGPGEPYMIIEEYGTPLGIEIIINHVGDCFD